MEKSTKTAGTSIKQMIGVAAGIAGTIGLFRTLRTAVDGAVSRFDTLTNFPRVMEMMGHSADESESAINKLSDGIDGLPTTLDSVASTTQRIATMTGDLGGAVDTTLALNNAFLASGSSSADASRGLEQYVQMLAKGETDLQSWRTLQETMPVALTKTAEAFGFAGASAQNDLYDALKEGEITFDDFNGKLIELSNATGGFADMAKESSTGIATSWQNVQTAVVKGVADMISTIDDSLSSFGGISGVFDTLKETVNSTFSSINENLPIMIDNVKAVYDNLKPWIPLMLSVTTGILTVVTAIKAFYATKAMITAIKVAVMALNTTVWANPWTYVAMAAVAAVLLIIKYWDPISEFFINLWGKVTEISMSVWESLKGYWNSIVNWFMSVWNPIADFFVGLWDNITNIFNSSLTFIRELISRIMNSEIVTELMATVEFWKNIFMTAWQFISNVFMTFINIIKTVVGNWLSEKQEQVSTVMEIIKSVFQTVWGAISALLKPIINGIKTFISVTMNAISSVVTVYLNAVSNTFKVIWNVISRIVSQNMENIKAVITVVMNGIKTFFQVIWEVVKGVFVSAMKFLRGDVEGGMERIKQTIENVMNLISDFFSNTWDSIKNIFSNSLSTVKDLVSDGISGALNVVTNLFGDFKDAGKNIVSSIADGIKDNVKKVTDAIGNVTQKIRDFLPFSPAKEGALRDIMKIQIPQSIAESINKGRNSAVRAMSGLTNAINGEMPVMNVGGAISDINRQTQAQLSNNVSAELSVNKQPIEINIYDNKEAVRAYVNENNAIDARFRRF